MGRADEDDAANAGHGIEEEQAFELGAGVGMKFQAVEGNAACQCPEVVASGHRQQFGDEAPHAVPDEDHLVKRRVRAIRIELSS